MSSVLPILTSDDFATDQEVRWCPGCGDFSILAHIKQALAESGVARENIVFVSGIGCAGRLLHYLDTYGLHGIAGRAPALATGLKAANPHLQVWVVTGDGDGLSFGTNHLLHALRRNVDIKILLFNNEVFGLTKGQTSPTSRLGTRTKSTPEGSFERPLSATALALAAGATFVARSIDVDAIHLSAVLRRAAAHRGTAFVEIYQNCKIYNDGVFDYATDPFVKADHVIYLEQERPLLFGKDRNRGIRLRDGAPEIVELSNGADDAGLVLHDEQATLSRAFLLTELQGPDFPECFGVFRSVESPTFEALLDESSALAKKAKGYATLDALLAGDEPWTVA
ncbi:MAG: 2-oxoacid:ferredoxin oxidoreductase subunit beta [Gemmataceae bacterium]|nr:2-oxoacid:ferredoxin oxidoreductase subunit beta [Gemmataceae bacterium]MCI0742863.1 2-oxoacid:ferredoxin oxidoreductase subunit beta [Gemmataceae bacterium]